MTRTRGTPADQRDSGRPDGRREAWSHDSPACQLTLLVLDNVITHDAKLVRAGLAQPKHARLRLLWLPKYSAHDHTPIERIWGLLKDHLAANRLYGSIDLLVARAERYPAERPERVRLEYVRVQTDQAAQAGVVGWVGEEPSSGGRSRSVGRRRSAPR